MAWRASVALPLVSLSILARTTVSFFILVLPRLVVSL